MSTTTQPLDLAAVKRRQQQTWSAGDYAEVGATPGSGADESLSTAPRRDHEGRKQVHLIDFAAEAPYDAISLPWL